MSKIFHYVFSTYKRKRILIKEVTEILEELFEEIAEEKGLEILCQNILSDHVHLLVRKQDSDRNEYVMKTIKGASSRRFFKENPTNRFVFRKLWGRSYRAEEIKDEKHLEQVISYIKGQKIKGIDKRAKPDWKPRRLVSGFQSN